MEQQLKQLAAAISNPMFADRETLKEAWDYVLQVANASENPPAVLTAVYVVTNTIGKVITDLLKEG